MSPISPKPVRVQWGVEVKLQYSTFAPWKLNCGLDWVSMAQTVYVLFMIPININQLELKFH